MNQIKKLAGQTAIYGLSSILGRFLNFLLIPLYTRIFLPDQFGVVTELYTYVVFLLIFLTFGMETGYFRFMQNEEKRENVYSTILMSIFSLSSLFIVLTIFFVTEICSFLQYENDYIFIILIAVIVSIDAFTAIPFAKLRQKNKPLRFAIIKLINIGTNIGLNILFLLVIPYFPKLNTLLTNIVGTNIVVYVFISNLIASIITLLLLLPEIFDEHLIFDFKLFKQIFAYSFPLLVVGIAGQTNELIDRILLKHYIEVPAGITDANQYILSQIGIYGANYKLSVIITIFIQAFRYAFEPMVFNKSKSSDSKQLYADIMKYFVVFCLAIFLVLMFYIDIVKYFIGDKYYAGLHIVPIALLSNIFLGIVFNLSLWYKLSDKTYYGIVITVLGSIITIMLNIIFIPLYGYAASAWTHLVCYISIAILSYVLGRKFYDVPYDIKKIVGYIFLSLILYFISTILPFHDLLIKLTLNTVLLFVFLAIVFKIENIKGLLKFKKS